MSHTPTFTVDDLKLLHAALSFADNYHSPQRERLRRRYLTALDAYDPNSRPLDFPSVAASGGGAD